ILEGVILPWGEPSGHLRRSVIPGLADAYEFDPAKPWGKISKDARSAILHGSGKMKIRYPYKAGGSKGHYEDHWEGVVASVQRRYAETASESVRSQLEEFMSTLPCDACGGSRLKPESLSVTVAGVSIGTVVQFSVDEAIDFFSSLPVQGAKKPSGHKVAPGPMLPVEIAGPILKEVL